MTATAGPHLPTIDSDSEAWWAAIQHGKLTVNGCSDCGRSSLYVRPFCPHCWSDQISLVAASGRGLLYTWSVIHQNVPPFAERTPYVLAMIDLVEGPRVMSVIDDCPVTELSAGMELEVFFRDIGGGWTVPAFRPLSS